MPASSAAFCAFSRVRLQMAATSQPSERNAGTCTCAPKPTPMMPMLFLDEAMISSRRRRMTDRTNTTADPTEDKRPRYMLHVVGTGELRAALLNISHKRSENHDDRRIHRQPRTRREFRARPALVF